VLRVGERRLVLRELVDFNSSIEFHPCLLSKDLLTTVLQVLVSIDLATRLPFYPRIDYFVDHDLLPDSAQLHFRFVFRDALSP